MAGHRATRNAKARKKYKAAKKLAATPKKNPTVTKIGRPTEYDEDRHCPWARGLAAGGLTVDQIAESMQISKKTVYAWMREHVHFKVAIQTGRHETVARIKSSLIKKAEGFSVPVEDKHVKQKGMYVEDKETGEKKFVVLSEEREKTQKMIHYPPDPKAAAVMLVNLDPSFRTERTAMELTGPGGGPLAVEKTIIVLPDNHRGPAPKVLPADVKKIE